MSSRKRIMNVGAAARASDAQAIANVAAGADDRALEVICTPGPDPKGIIPLSSESATVDPRALVVGQDTDATVPSGKVRVRPAHFIAGGSPDGITLDPNLIGMSCKLDVATDIAVASNGGGSARADLLYAVLSYGTSTSESVRQKPSGGAAPLTVLLATEKQPTVVLGIVTGVSLSSPAASLPADDLVNGVYNFALAALLVPSGYSGAAFNQSAIAPLWVRGWVHQHRVHGFKPMSLYADVISERPLGTLPSGRWGSLRKFFGHLRLLSTTPLFGNNAGTIVDRSIDWRHRILWIDVAYLGSAAVALEAATIQSAASPQASPPTAGRYCFTTGPGGGTSGTQPSLMYGSGSGVAFNVDTSGALRICRIGLGVPLDTANGDSITIAIEATDQFIAGV
jgi:hypothetical protein